jgi:hypothetical protein
MISDKTLEFKTRATRSEEHKVTNNICNYEYLVEQHAFGVACDASKLSDYSRLDSSTHCRRNNAFLPTRTTHNMLRSEVYPTSAHDWTFSL